MIIWPQHYLDKLFILLCMLNIKQHMCKYWHLRSVDTTNSCWYFITNTLTSNSNLKGLERRVKIYNFLMVVKCSILFPTFICSIRMMAAEIKPKDWMMWCALFLESMTHDIKSIKVNDSNFSLGIEFKKSKQKSKINLRRIMKLDTQVSLQHWSGR